METTIYVRFNYGRMVAAFSNVEDLKNWVKKSDLYQPFMYTIHGHGGETDLVKYKKSLE